MSILEASLQPPLLTILSSTSTPAISPLWDTTIDPTLPGESFITVLDDSSLAPKSKWDHRSNRTYIPKHDVRGPLAGPVIHLQSPTLESTFIQAGISSTDFKRRLAKGKGREGALPLGVALPWLQLQLRPLGRRQLAFEIGVVDSRGREGIVRCSRSKKSPTLHPYRSPPLIHLPLQTPTPGTSTLTPWLDISMNLESLLPLFQALPRPQTHHDDPVQPKSRRMSELPAGKFASVSYVRVYANCRLRRLWFSQDGERTMRDIGVEDEFVLFAATDEP